MMQISCVIRSDGGWMTEGKKKQRVDPRGCCSGSVASDFSKRVTERRN